MESIDINCDMGESFGNWIMGDDSGMMERVTTANVACGFHASDPLTMLETVSLAKKNNVKIGSHPGLPDLLGFGRRIMNITAEDAYAYVVYQTGALQAALNVHNMELNHIKPHGAFYSILKQDEIIAEAVAEAISKLSSNPMLYWPAPTDAALPTAAKKLGIRVIGEIYPDLQYDNDGGLVIQRKKHETDTNFAVKQVRQFVQTGTVSSIEGRTVELDAESICIHGDGPNALEITDAIIKELNHLKCFVKPINQLNK